MRKQPTLEQKAKAAERRERFRAIWKQVAAMPEAERAAKFENMPLVNVDGKPFSGSNMMLLFLQGGGTVFGGFRQWLAQGRAVRKGEHGKMIWCPTFKKTGAGAADVPADAESVEGMERRFVIGTVFDISQTDEITTETQNQEPAEALA